MVLFYVDPGGASLLMYILAPIFVALSVLSGWIKRKTLGAWERVSRLFERRG
jgi:hypothetical protein